MKKREERNDLPWWTSWILYDWATRLGYQHRCRYFPIYFALKASENALFGYMVSANLIVAVLAPIWALGDSGMKRKCGSAFMLIGVVFTALGPVLHADDARGFRDQQDRLSGSSLFYDSFHDVTTPERMDKSSWGFAMGARGSTIPSFSILVMI